MPTAPVSLIPALRRVIAGRTPDAPDADLLAAFVADHDADAFAALVRRHGPMVLGVCRRVVRDPDAADDAFQAVFLVLARRAGEVRPRCRVGGWLYGVAYRTALKARAVRARRRTRESQVDAMPEPAAPPAADVWDDLKPVLDEELARLPERLRLPVVLCDLEGRPQRAVAGQLGIAPATLAGRLADARRALAARLTRRGVALSAAGLASLLSARASAGVVNPQVAAGVVKAAEAVAAGGAAAGLVSANALQLCDGVMRMILLTKLKTAAATAVAVLVVAGGIGPSLRPAKADDPRPVAPPPAAKAARPPADTDAAFLDRICVELRGSKATPVEHVYFAADREAGKRHKVTQWLLADPAATAHLGGRPAEVVDLLTTVDEAHNELFFGGDPVRLRTTITEPVPAWVREFAGNLQTAGNKIGPDGKAVEVDVGGKKVVIVSDDGKGGVRYRVAAPPDAPAERNLLFYRYSTGAQPDGGKEDDRTADPKAKGPAPKTSLWEVKPRVQGVNGALRYWVATADTDEAFLRRAVSEARDTAPTAIEERYFKADPDPKKREKLLDALLADPAAARRVGESWKQRMLAPRPQPVPFTHPDLARPMTRNEQNFDLFIPRVVDPTTPHLLVQPKGGGVTDLLIQPKVEVIPPKAATPPTPPTPPQGVRVTARLTAGNPWPRLVGELIAAGKTDEQILEALTLATAARLPTDVERRLVLATIPTAGDRAAAWAAVARALAGPVAVPVALPPVPKSK